MRYHDDEFVLAWMRVVRRIVKSLLSPRDNGSKKEEEETVMVQDWRDGEAGLGGMKRTSLSLHGSPPKPRQGE